MHVHTWRYSTSHAKFCSTLLFYQIYYENRSNCSIFRKKKIVSHYRPNFLSCLKSSRRATTQGPSHGELPQDTVDPALQLSVPEGNATPQLLPAQRATQPAACHCPTHLLYIQAHFPHSRLPHRVQGAHRDWHLSRNPENSTPMKSVLRNKSTTKV